MMSTKRALSLLIAILCASFLLNAHAETRPDPREQLRWLDTANAAEMFADDVKSGTLRFYAVYGYGRSIPSITLFNYERCYKNHVSLETIKGTSDVCIDLEHGSLNRKARDFSRQYNTLMRQYLQENKLSDCSAACDWDTAYHQLAELIREQELSPDETNRFLYKPVNYDFEHQQFGICLEDPGLIERVKTKTCQLFAQCSDNAPAIFWVARYEKRCRTGLPVISQFACFQGKVLETLPDKESPVK